MNFNQGFNPPYEDTDTLVLTGPSGKFVDVRFPKDVSSPDQLSFHPSFWAFSGRSETTFHDASTQKHAIDMPYTAHCRFLHDIDSRGPGFVDEGDVFLLMNGDCMESGMMLNPQSNQVELYKEIWVDPRSSAIGTSAVSPPGQMCIVAETTKSSSARGIAFRMLDYFQGILQMESQGEVLVERQTRQKGPSAPVKRADEAMSNAPDLWTRDHRSTADLPAAWLSASVRKMGDTINHRGVEWTVTELAVV